MWANKRVVILGAARQGTALARYLVAQGARVTLSDMNAAADVSALQDIQPRITFALGGHPLSLLDGCDMLCLSGGVPIDLPIVLEARRRGIPLSNDAQVFFEVCPAPIIGITGSAGKTTTTTLIGEMLRGQRSDIRGQISEAASSQQPAATNRQPSATSHQVWVGGNIGNPLISDAGQIQASDHVVMELSSFQLELMTRSPHIACITNITPNHLDRHGTMDAYTAAKRHILDFQTADDWQVLCADDPITRTLNSAARTAWFSLREEPQGDGAWMDEAGELRLKLAEVQGDDGRWTTDDLRTVVRRPSSVVSATICHRRDLQLMGAHNVLNVLAASLVSAIAGASLEAIRQVATTFRGVAHRLQLVSDLNGARWYDDSIATAPERLMAALLCFDQKVILLCGGRDKHLPWADAAQLMLQSCKHILLFGEMGPMVAEELRMKKSDIRLQTSEKTTPQVDLTSDIWLLPNLEAAVAEARRLAGPGDVVLLSPGGTSYDAFKDFAERGRAFREMVIYRDVEAHDV